MIWLTRFNSDCFIIMMAIVIFGQIDVIDNFLASFSPFHLFPFTFLPKYEKSCIISVVYVKLREKSCIISVVYVKLFAFGKMVLFTIWLFSEFFLCW